MSIDEKSCRSHTLSRWVCETNLSLISRAPVCVRQYKSQYKIGLSWRLIYNSVIKHPLDILSYGFTNKHTAVNEVVRLLWFAVRTNDGARKYFEITKTVHCRLKRISADLRCLPYLELFPGSMPHCRRLLLQVQVWPRCRLRL